MSVWTAVFGRATFAADYPFGYDFKEILERALKKVKGLKYDDYVLSWEPSLREVLESLQNVESDMKCLSYPHINVHKKGDRSKDIIELDQSYGNMLVNIPILPALPHGAEGPVTIRTITNYKREGDIFNIDVLIDGPLRSFAENEIKYLLFWLETLAAVLGVSVICTYSCDEKVINVYTADTMYGLDAQIEKRAEKLAEYIQMFIDWLYYENQYCKKAYGDPSLTVEEINRLNREHKSWQEYIIDRITKQEIKIDE